jgi:glycosyltransferase involved in cell wall biosynthesis
VKVEAASSAVRPSLPAPASLRVLVAHSFYRLSGGEDRYVTDQIALLRHRHVVELLRRDNEDLSGGAGTLAQMTFSRAQERAVTEVVAAFRPDLVHLHNAYPSLGPAVHRAAARLRVPLVMTVHNYRLRCPNGYLFTEGERCRRCEGGAYHNAVMHRCFESKAQAAGYATALWTHRFVLDLPSKVDLFIAPSEFVGRRLLEWGLPPERIEVVPHPTTLRPATTAPGDYGLYAGRLSPEKGLDLLLEALGAAGNPPFKVVGGGPLLERLEARARALGLDATRFMGHVSSEEVGRLLAGARFVVVPSLWEEVAGLAAIEAMAAGRPLLVADSGGLPELVRGGEGLSFPAGDTRALADGIERLFADTELCVAAGERGLARARAEFSPESHLEGLEAAYRRVLDRQHRPRWTEGPESDPPSPSHA